MEEETKSDSPIVKPPSAFSFKEGIDLYLTHNKHRVCVNISSWSGAERIYINGELCIKGRNILSKTSKHSFTIGDNAYCVVINIESLLKGDISARLYLGDTVVDNAYISLDEKFEEGQLDEGRVSEQIKQNNKEDTDQPSTISSVVTTILGAIGTYFLISQLFDWLFK